MSHDSAVFLMTETKGQEKVAQTGSVSEKTEIQKERWHMNKKTRCRFHHRFKRAFFVQKKLQSQNLSRKKTFVRKKR